MMAAADERPPARLYHKASSASAEGRRMIYLLMSSMLVRRECRSASALSDTFISRARKKLEAAKASRFSHHELDLISTGAAMRATAR